MNTRAFRTSWPRIRSEVRRRWRALSDDDVDEIEGRPARLVRKLRERCGVPESQAAAQVEAWFATVDDRPVVRR